MPRLELNQLLAQYSLTPEQQLFITWFYSQFDNNSAVHRQILNVEPLFYMGAIGGSEFLVYAVTKLYLALTMSADSPMSGGGALAGLILYNEANAIHFNMDFDSVFYDPVALNYKTVNNSHEFKNCYFSRFVQGGVVNLKFIGYRITLN
jgi:hypothetical protein